MVLSIISLDLQLKYTDDPDISVASPSQPDSAEEEIERVGRLFAALEGRRQSLTGKNSEEVFIRNNNKQVVSSYSFH